MADAAKAANVAGAIKPPEYRKAVQTMRASIPQKKDRISSLNGEIADVWGKIEGMRVNKKAAKIFLKLDALEENERVEIFRSLNGLIDAAGWPKTEGDLADQADGNVVDMRVGKGGAKANGDGKVPSREEALERARGHLGTGGAPDATDGPDGNRQAAE